MLCGGVRQMVIQDDCPTYTPGETYESVLFQAALAAKWKEPPRDALDTMVLKTSGQDLRKCDVYEQLDFVPFDPRTKRTEGKLKGPDGNIFRITKGAPHVVLEISLLWRVPSSCTLSSTCFAQTGRGQLARARHTRCALACTGAHGPRGWRMEDAGHSHLPRPPAPRHQGHNREVRLLRRPR